MASALPGAAGHPGTGRRTARPDSLRRPGLVSSTPPKPPKAVRSAEATVAPMAMTRQEGQPEPTAGRAARSVTRQGRKPETAARSTLGARHLGDQGRCDPHHDAIALSALPAAHHSWLVPVCVRAGAAGRPPSGLRQRGCREECPWRHRGRGGRGRWMAVLPIVAGPATFGRAELCGRSAWASDLKSTGVSDPRVDDREPGLLVDAERTGEILGVHLQ